MSALSHAPHFAAQAILAGPQTAAPPAYNGVGWLVVGNLGTMTSYAWLGGMVIAALLVELVRNRHLGRDHPANVARQIALLGACCFTIRCMAEAVQLWTWSPRDVETAAWARTLKHYVDPIAVTLGASAIARGTLAWRSLMAQLSSEPFPVPFWTKLPMLKRPACVVLLGFIAAIGVVSTR